MRSWHDRHSAAKFRGAVAGDGSFLNLENVEESSTLSNYFSSNDTISGHALFCSGELTRDAFSESKRLERTSRDAGERECASGASEREREGGFLLFLPFPSLS